jgi:hypothetical protein
MTAALKVKGPATTRGRRGVDRAIRVTTTALSFLRVAGTSKPERKRELERIVRAYQRRAIDDVLRLIGRRISRVNPRTGEGEHLVVTAQIARTWCVLVDALLANVRKFSTSSGELQPLAPIDRRLQSRLAHVGQRTFTTWMPWLEAAGVLLYHHGRSRHPGIVGWPELYRLHLPHTRAVVEGHLRSALLHDEDRWWWKPMCLALLESERASRTDEGAGDARAELAGAVAAVELARVEWEENKTAAINAAVCTAKSREHELQRARRQAELAQRVHEEEVQRQVEARRAEEAAAKESRRAVAEAELQRARASLALQKKQLDGAVRDARVAHAIAVANEISQRSGSHRNPPSGLILDRRFTGSTAPAPPSRPEPGEIAAPAAQKGTPYAPDGAGDVRARLLRIGGVVLVDDGPEANRESSDRTSSRRRLVPVRSGDT